MEKILSGILLVIALFWSLQTLAQESYPFFNIGLGSNQMDFAGTVATDADLFEGSSGSGGIAGSLGYKFESSIVVEIAGSATQSLDLFGLGDSYSADHREMSLGYRIEKNGFFVTPKIGALSWKISGTEGRAFSAGAEESDSISDNGTVYGVSLGYVIRGNKSLTLAYKTSKTDEVELDFYSLGISVPF